MFLAVLGNILVQYVIPWPEFMTVSYEAAAEELAAYPLGVYLALTLLIAPLLEEGIFRKGLYGILRKWFGVIFVSVYISRRIWSVSWKLDPGDIRFCFWLAAFLGI